MTEWYWQDNGQRRGPISSQELKTLAEAGRITPTTGVMREGVTDWVPASRVKGLFDSTVRPPPPSHDADAQATTSSVFGNVCGRANDFVRGLKQLNWREEIFPIDQSSIREMTQDYVFWCVVLLGILPQLIGTIEDFRIQLTVYSFFFAAMWGVVFRDLVLRTPVRWKWLLGTSVFTGVFGLNGLLLLYEHILPGGYTRMPGSQNTLVSLVGGVLQTGVLEELCKAVPVIAYLVWKRREADPMTAILLGVFSGLGFAAFETVSYGGRTLNSSSVLAQEYGLAGAELSRRGAMITVLLRSLSTVFGHAVLSGIVAYFLVVAYMTGWRAPVLAVVGLGVAAILHGSYNWLAGLQRTFAALLDVGAFVLFYAYISKLRTVIPADAPTD